MNTTRLTCAALLLAAGITSAAEQSTFSLSAAQDPYPRAFPFCGAKLSINNNMGREISAVRLRWTRGGPTMVFAAAVPAGEQADITVFLPAISVSQDYRVEPLDRDGKAMDPAKASITWPADMVTRETFIDEPTCSEWMDELPEWPARTKVELLIVFVLAIIAISAALLIRNGLLKTCVIPAVAAASVIGVNFVVSRAGMDPMIRHEGQLIIMNCRNTCTATLLPGDEPGVPPAAPIYVAPWHMEEDSTIIHSVDGLSVPLSPDITRVFRRTGRQKD
jgi:hypothetical protein